MNKRGSSLAWIIGSVVAIIVLFSLFAFSFGGSDDSYQASNNQNGGDSDNLGNSNEFRLCTGDESTASTEFSCQCKSLCESISEASQVRLDSAVGILWTVLEQEGTVSSCEMGCERVVTEKPEQYAQTISSLKTIDALAQQDKRIAELY